jgi:hypothetical protein
MDAFEWALNDKDIDVIGVSILACPIALGVNESAFGDGQRNDSYRMQRFLSRYRIFKELGKRGLLTDAARKRFHCLGMTDGPREIELLSPFHRFIRSWDSSSAFLHGSLGIRYDNSPTGLMNGKNETEVDFNFHTDSVENQHKALYNAHFINGLCE